MTSTMNRLTIPPCDSHLAPPPIDVPFEGVEKRLVMQLLPSSSMIDPFDFTAEEWQSILNYAHCEIISSKELKGTKVYLLSESTLTVWPWGFLLKTCGRTTPFLVLDVFSSFIYSNKEQFVQNIQWLFYSRLDFLHPIYQIWPHQSFEQETHFIHSLLPLATPFQLGQDPTAMLGFVYTSENQQQNIRTMQFQEALMIGIDRHSVRSFSGFDTEKERLEQQEDASDIRGALSTLDWGCYVQIDPFWFNPYGYSCNALAHAANTSSPATYFSCHVSPEPETSYASLEVGGDPNENYIFPIIQWTSAYQPQHIHITEVVINGLKQPTNDDNESEFRKAYGESIPVLQTVQSFKSGYIQIHHFLYRSPPVNNYLSLADFTRLTHNNTPTSQNDGALLKKLTATDGVTHTTCTATGAEEEDSSSGAEYTPSLSCS